MANPICTISSLTNNCYLVPTTISPKQEKALKILAKVLELAAIGGTNYSASMTTTLLSDAAALTCGMELADRDAARVHLAFVQAMAAGASVPAGISGKQALINCLVQADDDALDEADLLLTCKLGVHKAYPQ